MPYSSKWKTWKSIDDLKRCLKCEENNGKIYAMDEIVDPKPPIHFNCRCFIAKLEKLLAGNATKLGVKGADWYLKYYGKLPDYYITEKDAKSLGYKKKLGNLHDVLPGRMIFRGIYKNKNGHLPSADGRIWYEADINYEQGYRNTERILFSNDGLIFVTYDHYFNFIEIQ